MAKTLRLKQKFQFSFQSSVIIFKQKSQYFDVLFEIVFQAILKSGTCDTPLLLLESNERRK